MRQLPSSEGWFKGYSLQANSWLKDPSTHVYTRKLREEHRGALHREFHGGVTPENPFVSKDPNTSQIIEHLTYVNPVTRRTFRKRVIARNYNFKLSTSKEQKSLHEQYSEILDRVSLDEEEALKLRNQEERSEAAATVPPNEVFMVNLGNNKRVVVRKAEHRSFVDFRHFKSPNERLNTLTLSQKHFRILQSSKEEIDRMIESKEYGQIRLSSKCYVTVERIDGKWSVDIRMFNIKKDKKLKGPMRSPTEKGISLSYNNWGRLYMKMSAIGKAFQ